MLLNDENYFSPTLFEFISLDKPDLDELKCNDRITDFRKYIAESLGYSQGIDDNNKPFTVYKFIITTKNDNPDNSNGSYN